MHPPREPGHLPPVWASRLCQGNERWTVLKYASRIPRSCTYPPLSSYTCPPYTIHNSSINTTQRRLGIKRHHQYNMFGQRQWTSAAFWHALSLVFIAQLAYAARHDGSPPADPFADPKHDPFNPLKYIASNTLSAIGVGECSINALSISLQPVSFYRMTEDWNNVMLCRSGSYVGRSLTEIASSLIHDRGGMSRSAFHTWCNIIADTILSLLAQLLPSRSRSSTHG